MSDRPASSTQQLDDKPNTFLFLSATVLIITVVVCFVLSYLPVCVILSNCGSCCDCKTVNKSSDTVYHTRGVKKPRDCQDIQSAGQNSSGVYHVTPRGTHNGFDVYCDMETEDGGWLVSNYSCISDGISVNPTGARKCRERGVRLLSCMTSACF